jgi:aryl-alcohol dehydrogenase-like predicted oxidoreductase
LRTHPIVVAPLVGASKTAQIDDAVASLEIQLTDEEITDLERAYTLTERPDRSLQKRTSTAAHQRRQFSIA